jgi:hypothetical protein
MLVDRIALLERQLESAEKQVRNAEEGARNAKSALAAALLTKARHQKSEPGSENPRVNGASQQPDPSEVSDDAADALRQEYEQRFRTARERLVEEFQERLNNAKAAWEADVARQPRRESADGFNLMPGRLLPFLKNETGNGQAMQELASSLPVAFRRLFRSLAHRPAALLLAVAAATGTFLGWSALSGKYAPSEPAPSVATAPSPSEIAPPAPVPPAPAPVTSAPAPIPQAEAALVPATDMPATEALPDRADKAQASDAVAEPMGPAQPLQAPIEQQPATPEPSAAPLQEELNALRERLDATTKRARLAEETLRAERRKTAAAQARQVQTGLKELAPALPRVAAPAQVPGQGSDAGPAPDRRPGRFQPAE